MATAEPPARRTPADPPRRVAVLGGSRVPFARANGQGVTAILER